MIIIKIIYRNFLLLRFYSLWIMIMNNNNNNNNNIK